METKKLRALDPLLHPQSEDLLHQESQFIKHFYELITQSIEPPFAVSVDGLWGTGKTTVMQTLKKRLHKEGYSTFWFNPWEYRKTESIVLAFLQSFAAAHRDKINELQRSGGTMFKVLLKAGMGAALKIYTKGNVSLKDVEKDLEKLEKDQQASYKAYENSIETIKSEFQELIEKVSAKYTNKTVFIFFDDLDRCLPDDAIQLLEALKNLFVTPNCNAVFICGIDTRVAKNFISKHYSGIEDNFAINYFRKIFNLTISMPYSAKTKELLLKYIKEFQIWDEEDSEALATMIYNRGIQTEISSIRKYLNIVHNFYTFTQFNPDYAFDQDNDLIINLLIIKEVWQTLYEDLVQTALRERTNMEALIKKFLDTYRVKNLLLLEQERFLSDYLGRGDSSFAKEHLSTLLVKYPTLA